MIFPNLRDKHREIFFEASIPNYEMEYKVINLKHTFTTLNKEKKQKRFMIEI